MEATENEGIDAEVRTTDGPTSLQKHVIPYNFLHRMPVEALCSARARLLLLAGHHGCEGGTCEHEPPGSGAVPSGVQGQSFWSVGQGGGPSLR